MQTTDWSQLHYDTINSYKQQTSPTTKQTDWAHLPNAKHIDWVIASLTEYPGKWSATWNRIIDGPTVIDRDPVYNTAFDILTPTRRQAWRAATNAVWDIDGPYWAPRSVVLALVAWDDCAYMIGSDVGELTLLAKLGDPRAILLLPGCIIFNETNTCNFPTASI